MKATVWLWPFVTTLLCASQFVCTAQREFQDYADSSLMEDDFLLTKRAKPSLSIANPLDVLRQRLLLETARRQMREKTRQVKLNREILDTVGKRANMKYNHFVDFLRDADENIINNNINNKNNKNNKKVLSDDNDYQIRYLYSLQKNRYTRK